MPTMPHKIKFAFVRTRKVADTGTLVITVDNPTNQTELISKLNQRQFSEFLIQDSESDGEQWTFKPLQRKNKHGSNFTVVIPFTQDS